MAFGFDPRQRAGLTALGYKPPVNPWEEDDLSPNRRSMLRGYEGENVVGFTPTPEGHPFGNEAIPIIEEVTSVPPSLEDSWLQRLAGASDPEDEGWKTAETNRIVGEAAGRARVGTYGKDIFLGPEGDTAPHTRQAGGAGPTPHGGPGQLAPPSPANPISTSDPQWREKIAALDAQVKARAHGMSAGPGSRLISSLSSADRDPMFADVNQDAPEALDRVGTLQRRELATGGTEWTGSPHEGIDPTTGQPTKYGSISITMHGQESPEDRARVIEGLRSRAFNAAPAGPDPQAEAMMRLAGVGGGGGHIMQGVAGPDVSQATLEHAMQQRAAQAQLSDMESQARARAAEATARERDPLGIERLKAQQALEAARFGYQNEGRREVSLADDQFRAQQKAARDAEEQRIITDHLDTKRALQERLAQFPSNLPPGSPEAAQAAMLQRQLDSLNEETQLQLSRLGVRLPNTPY